MTSLIMHLEIRQSRTPDLRTSGAVSLAAHAMVLLLVGAAVTHSRARFTPPAIRVIRLDVDLPAPMAAKNALAAPSASPVEAAVPQVAAPPRPALAMQNEERLQPSAAPQDVTPAQQDSVEPLVPTATGVTTFVATETTAKRLFGTGAEDMPDAIPAGRTGPAGGNASGLGIEGPISLRNGMKPPYPLGSRQRGEEGTVVIEARVATDGHASSVAVISSSRFMDLDRAAVRAVKRATFNPATEDGRPVEARAHITIIFRLTN